jgi:hypothetical protein
MHGATKKGNKKNKREVIVYIVTEEEVEFLDS